MNGGRIEQILEQLWVSLSLSFLEELIRDHEIEVESIFLFLFERNDLTKEECDRKKVVVS